MALTRILQKAVAHARHERVALAISIGNAAGVLLLIALGYLYQLKLTAWILGWLLISGLANVLLAWNNERRLAAGRSRTWHEIVGRGVTACTCFERHGRSYRGMVQLGAERWQAVSRAPLAPGQGAVVAARHGLVLEVEPTGDARH